MLIDHFRIPMAGPDLARNWPIYDAAVAILDAQVTDTINRNHSKTAFLNTFPHSHRWCVQVKYSYSSSILHKVVLDTACILADLFVEFQYATTLRKGASLLEGAPLTRGKTRANTAEFISNLVIFLCFYSPFLLPQAVS